MAKNIFLTIFFTSVIVFSNIIYPFAEDTKPNIERNAEAQEQLCLASARKKTGNLKETDQYRDGLAAYIQSVNDDVSDAQAEHIVTSIMTSAEKYDIDEKLVMAIAQVESTYDADAVSCADYKGLMQTGDVLAEAAGYTPEQLFDPQVSVEVGTGYIHEKLEEFGDTRLALTAYNQGAGTVYSGRYCTKYAEKALSSMDAVESFLQQNGYVNVYN